MATTRAYVLYLFLGVNCNPKGILSDILICIFSRR